MAVTDSTHLLLTGRDLKILMMVYVYGGCTADHIRRRYFPTSATRSSASYARIARLVEAGYLTSLRLPSFSGIGSGKAFLTPGPKARPILAKTLGLSRTELARLRMDSPLFIAHHLALCDLRLALEIASERSAVFTLQEWIGDRTLNQTPIKVKDPQTERIVSFVPDCKISMLL